MYNMAIKEYKKNKVVKLSKNFKSTEFDCNGKSCCSKTLIDPKLVEFLQNIRDHFGKPLYISSSYRCIKHNRAIGSKDTSKHTQGMAADIKVDGVEPAEVAKYAESIGVLGIGLYDTDKDGHFVHIDSRTEKSFWYGHAQEYRSTFGGSVAVEHSGIMEWQKAAIKDGYKFPSGADGIWGGECEAVAKKAICKKPLIKGLYKQKNLTKIIQKAVGVNPDGKYGKDTELAVIKWQKLMGLMADGIVGYNTWKKILGV